MKKFKRIFYPIYLILGLGIGYLSIDGLLDVEAKTLWFSETFGENGETWLLVVFALLSVAMLTELISENVHIRKVKSGISDLEDEILRLKAKLFDESDFDDEGDEDDDENDD